MAEVEAVCVTKFPRSTTRQPIMTGLTTFVDALKASGVVGDLWLDGSFLTQKIDPKDVDVVLVCDGALYNSGASFEYCQAVDWVIANQKTTLACDSYALFLYPAGSPLYDEGQWWYSYWHKQWGFSREDNPKGIAVITLTGTTP